MSVDRLPFGRARAIGAAVSALSLLLPASAIIPRTQWNLHLWQRLRAAQRASPDVQLDRYYRQLVSFLPAAGPVGLHNVGAPDDGRLKFRLQYALAPRRIVASTEPAFVIACGLAASEGSVARDPRFILIAALDDDLRVYRRVQP